MIVSRIRHLGIRSPIKGFGAILSFFFIAGMLAIACSNTLAAAHEEAVTGEQDGITLIGLFPLPGGDFDVPIVDPRDAIVRIKKALSIIERESPKSARRLQTLKDNGPVTIVYDPQYPNPKLHRGTVEVAVFLPKFLPPSDPRFKSGKDFLVVVGRHGIKWPVRELAAVFVHELAGHGMQHFTGRREIMRNMDMECEAWLFQEMAHQDFGIDKLSRSMVRFQKQLASVCDHFIRYLRKTDPEGTRLWENLNPDVPKLLTRFENYLNKLRDRAVVSDSKRYSQKLQEDDRRRIFHQGIAPEIERVGVLYLHGIGSRPDYITAAKWFRRAADLGHAPAQFRLAVLYLDGKGVPKSLERTYFWLTLALHRGVEKMKTKTMNLWKTVGQRLTPDQISAIRKKARDWRPKSVEPE